MGEKTIVSVAYKCYKDLNKNQLTLLQLCVSSFLCGSRTNLWPFNGCYWNWFALSIIDSQGWVLERSSHSDLLKKNSHKFTPKAPIASILRYIDPRA